MRFIVFTYKSAPGIILFRGANYSEVEMLKLINRTLENVSEKDLESSIVVVDKTRIRKRRLPLTLED